MNRSKYSIDLLILSIFLVMLCGCTEFPFGHDVVAYGNRQVRGRITLSDGSSPVGVYVWLEGLNISTYTDEQGRFSLILPSSESRQISGNVNSILNLYFYLANYRLATAEVVVHDGTFLPSYGDVDEKGEIYHNISLRKLLHIVTVVEPDSITTDFVGSLSVQLILRAVFDSVMVIFPKIIGGHSGLIFLRRLQTSDVFVDLPDISDNIQLIEKIGPEPRSWSMVFNIDRGSLPHGRYEIIPFLFVKQENVPEELLTSIEPNYGEVGLGYLRIPFKRNSNYLEIFLKE